MNGILIIDKPLALTSHDVVAQVRRATGQRKIGHAGTLDPLATGVLVLALGKATRTIEYLTNHDKKYEAKVRLGQATTTYDAEGEVISQHQGSFPTRQMLEAALEAFRGAIMQRPPLFSAIKKGGEALYKKARRGEVVKVEPRPIMITKLELTSWQPPDVGLTVHCSKGTYIRSLAHDYGAALGTGGHLVSLRRTASGAFTLADAYPLEDIITATPDQIQRLLKPIGTGLEAIPPLTVDQATINHIRQGGFLPATKEAITGPLRALDKDGCLVAILQWRDGRGWQPKKVFT